MKFQSLLIAGLLLVPCFAANATRVAKAYGEETVAENAECLALPNPMMEKVSSTCKVKCNCPSTCFKVCKTITQEDVYRIPSECKNSCTITDENGTHPCCEKTCCPAKCEREHKTHAHRCNRCK
jgi:hypothetical protein